MTDVADLTLEQRIELLEARLNPLATTPPITIGSLNNVPAPGAALQAQWAQDVTGLAVHRFANLAAINAWASAPNGALAVAVDTSVVWRRVGGVWSQFTPWSGSAAGIVSNGGTVVVSSLTVPSDPGPRIVHASGYLSIAIFYGAQAYIELLVDNNQVAIANIPRMTNILGTGANMPWNLQLVAGDVLAPVGRQFTVQVRVTPDQVGIGMYNTVANKLYNRVDALVTPKGY
jgi:hypothetical protein